MTELTLYSDGAARGNQHGPAGCGAVLYDAEGAEVAELGRYLGQATNNVAEYQGLLLGLERALALGATRLVVRADSEVMIRQVTGRYKVKAAHLRPLHALALSMLGKVARWDAEHIARELNTRADALANRAIDDALRATARGGAAEGP